MGVGMSQEECDDECAVIVRKQMNDLEEEWKIGAEKIRKENEIDFEKLLNEVWSDEDARRGIIANFKYIYWDVHGDKDKEPSNEDISEFLNGTMKQGLIEEIKRKPEVVDNNDAVRDLIITIIHDGYQQHLASERLHKINFTQLANDIFNNEVNINILRDFFETTGRTGSGEGRLTEEGVVERINMLKETVLTEADKIHNSIDRPNNQELIKILLETSFQLWTAAREATSQMYEAALSAPNVEDPVQHLAAMNEDQKEIINKLSQENVSMDVISNQLSQESISEEFSNHKKNHERKGKYKIIIIIILILLVFYIYRK